jgi:uncharacterized delta-60 repeat protein
MARSVSPRSRSSYRSRFARPQLEVLEDRCLLSAGQLDPTFGVAGKVLTSVQSPANERASAVVVTQTDGKIVAVGASYSPFSDPTALVVARYNADGSLDSNFASGGIDRYDRSTGLFLSPKAVSVDGFGRLLVAGTIGGGFAVVRLNADGTPDVNFGTGGRAMVGFSRFVSGFGVVSDNTFVTGEALDSSGRVVVMGMVSPRFGTGAQFAVARLNTDGTPDSNFGTGGKVTIDFGREAYFSPDSTSGVAIDPAGRIVVAGAFDYGLGVGVARLNADGSLDGSFGTGGKTTLGSFGGAADLALDPAGHIVVAGTYNPPPGVGNVFAVARLNGDGSLDGAFGDGGKTTLSFGNGYSHDLAGRMAIDSAGRIAVVGSTDAPSGNYLATAFAVALFKPDGCPDVDFGIGGKVTTHLGSGSSPTRDVAAGVSFDASGRLVVAGTTYGDGNTFVAEFAVVRYLGPDPVVEAGSATFAADLQAAVTALRTTPPPGTPRVVVHVSNPAQMPAFVSAVAALTVNPAGPEIEVLLDVDAGTYSLGQVSVPTGLRLILDGNGGACGPQTFTSSSAPVLTVVSGDVLIRDGAQFSSTANAPTILVQGGQLAVRDSTIQETTGGSQAALAITGGQVDLGTSDDYLDPNYGGNTINVNGPGVLMRLTGPNNVMAVGNTFAVDGVPLEDDFRIEDAIDHAMDGLGGGTVFWVPNNVFVTANNGSVQRGVNLVPAGGTVNVQTSVKGTFYVGSKLLTLADLNGGLTITQQADTLDATKRELLASDVNTGGSNSIKFLAGTNPGEVQLNFNNLLQGTFLPTGRLVAHAGPGDDVQVDSALTLSAWLYADGGNDRLKGGSGNNVLIGDSSGDLLVGGSGRNLLIGYGGDRLVSNGGQDLLIAGSTSYDADEVGLAAILAEWSSTDSLAARIANLTDNTASPLFSTNRLNDNYFLLNSGPNQTVFNDYSADTITAGSGPDLIFASSSDKITGLSAADILFLFS